MTEFHSVKSFSREEPRVELIESMLKSILDVVELEFEGQPVRVDGFRPRNIEDWRTVRETSLEQNLGSLSTVCNCKCTFCYEDGNPAGLFEKHPRFVSIAEAQTRLRHLHDGRGLFRESKGFFEPLANPEFLEILELIRAHDPGQVIDVTTNGALLTPELVSRLAELKPVYVNISLISSDPEMRGKVMGDRRAAVAIGAVELLREHGIPFMGTLVPWPQQGLDDITRTVEYLDANDARVIRVAMLGLTRHHPRYEKATIDAWQPRVVEHVSALRARLRTPIMISPYAAVSASLDAVVEGVIQGSPAAAAGVEVGDRVLAVDGTEVVSRQHASSLLRRAAGAKTAEVEILRAGVRVTSTLREPAAEVDAYPYKIQGVPPFDVPGMSFGVCLPGSFHLQYLKQINDAIQARQARRTLVVVSSLYRDLVGGLLAALPLREGSSLELVVPENAFFGGNVNVGDLWVLDDIARAVQPRLESAERPDLLLLPSSFLSRWGRDLRGVPYSELGAKLGIEVVLIDCERIVF
jgi:MoaA/NifB/PqqE/SkfB family radical SAM enzyme